MNVSIYIKDRYEEFYTLKAEKNKANLFRIEYCVMRIAKSSLKKQSQFATLTAKGAEQAPPNAHIKGKTENNREIV